MYQWFCVEDQKVELGGMEDMEIYLFSFLVSLDFILLLLFFSIALPGDGETPAYWDAYIRDYFGFECVFFVALHFGVLNRCQVIRHAGMKCNQFKWSKCSPSEYVVVFLGLALVAAVVAYHIYLLSEELVLLWGYGVAYAGFVLLLSIISYGFRKFRVFHPHHYFLACCLIPLARFNETGSQVFLGFLAGIAVEGIASRGLAPIWPSRIRIQMLSGWKKLAQNKDDYDCVQSHLVKPFKEESS